MVPKGNAGHLTYVSDFLDVSDFLEVEEAKATGLVKQIIDRASLRGLQVAPSGKAN